MAVAPEPTPRRHGITAKLTAVFVIFAAVLVGVMGGITFVTRRAALLRAAESELLSVATEKRAAIESWVGERADDIAEIARSPAIQSDLEQFSAAGGEEDLGRGLLPADLRGPAREAHARLVRELRSHLTPAAAFQELFLLAPSTGQVLAATDPRLEGLFKENMPYFINGRDGPYIQNPYYSLQHESAAMAAATPVRDQRGRVIGVLASQLNMGQMDAIVGRRAPRHASADAYLANEVRLFVTQPRLMDDLAVLRRGVDAAALANCRAADIQVGIGDDYRGVPVIGAYQWLPDRQLCLIVTIDQAEALAPLRELAVSLLLISAFALAGASLIAGLLARSLTHPVLALQAAAARFGRGELSAPIPEGPRDELGDLARALNAMAAALDAQRTQLRQYTAGLEGQVQLRTAELAATERRFRTLVELAPVGIFETDAADRCIFVNDRWSAITGIPASAALGDGWLSGLHPATQAEAAATWERITRAGSSYADELCWLRPDGSCRWTMVEMAMLRDAEGRTTGQMGALTDITPAKQAEHALREREAALEGALARQAVLLQEIHHRVKNNLQVVTSLLRIQRRRVDDPQVAAALGESQQRVAVMALVHELLYQSPDLMSIDAQTYFERLSGQIAQLFSAEAQRIRLGVACAGLHLSLEQAVPCGLLAHELLTNSFKYAFPDQRQGTITIDMRPLGPAMLQLQVADSGVGLPEPRPGGNSLGMQLIDGFVRQLRGTLVWSAGPGACATVHFPPRWPPPPSPPALAERIEP